jgi:pyridoxal phosphate phosphatase PHOSPHO2
MVLARVSRGLERRIKRDGDDMGLKCQVKYWDSAWEIEEVFAAL